MDGKGVENWPVANLAFSVRCLHMNDVRPEKLVNANPAQYYRDDKQEGFRYRETSWAILDQQDEHPGQEDHGITI